MAEESIPPVQPVQIENLISFSEIRDRYPIHALVWSNDSDSLMEKLQRYSEELEKKDPRGRTPLMLAVTLNHFDCANILIRHGASVYTETDGWSAVQEATATGSADLLTLLLNRKNYESQSARVSTIPDLLSKLKEAPDFYVEIKWEFTSWMPLVSKICPSDTYKVYKQGSKVRVDATLTGVNNEKWIRGNTSIIFQGDVWNGKLYAMGTNLKPPQYKSGKKMHHYNQDLRKYYECAVDTESTGTFLEVDHVSQRVVIVHNALASKNMMDTVTGTKSIRTRLSEPVVNTYVDTDKISFERNKSGVWGWRQDKTEDVNGHSCKVFSANNVEIVTRTRSEHLNAQNVEESDNNFANKNDVLCTTDLNVNIDTSFFVRIPDVHNTITIREYFTEGYDLKERYIGKLRDQNTKTRKFKANLWLCEDYPLSLQEQIMPIVDLLATKSSRFSKLKDFIEMQLPSGFPVKIEIPFMHVVNATVTFGNIFAMETPVEGVNKLEGDSRLMCYIDESVFVPPDSYTFVNMADETEDFSAFAPNNEDDSDEFLQMALQQSFLEHSTAADNNHGDEAVWNSVAVGNPNRIPEASDLLADQELQRVIEESLRSDVSHASNYPTGEVGPIASSVASSEDIDRQMVMDIELERVLALSRQEEEERERQIRAEEEMLEQVLRLSMDEK